MRKIMNRMLIFAAVLLIATLLTLLPNGTARAEEAPTDIAEVELCSAESADIIGDRSYTIVFDASFGKAAQLATDMRAALRQKLGVNAMVSNANMAEETQYEILIGNVDRDVSNRLRADVIDASDSAKYLVWGFLYEDGKLAYVANSDMAMEYSAEAFLALVTSEGLIMREGEIIFGKKLVSEYETELKEKEAAEKEAARQKKLEEIQAMQNAFTQEQFGDYKAMIGKDGYYAASPYPTPWFYPTPNQHPRLIINEDDVKTVRELLENPEYKKLAENFWALADADCEYGIFPAVVGKPSGEIYRFNSHYLAIMTCKAMAYLITGDELYALEAIVSIKNAMLTYIYTPDIHSDVYHGGSEVMFAVSLVYDWCHDMLTEEDKAHILAGIPNLCISTMEISYPPTNMGSVSGHGTGPQFLRDMMVVSTSVYDEAPDWWELVAGRYFAEYLPVANLSYGLGWVSQGTANYAYNKINVQLWAAMCVFGAAGEIVLNPEANLAEYFLLSHTMPESGNYFQTGDGGRTANGASRSWEYTSFFLAAALFGDPIVFANAKAMTLDFSKYTTNSVSFMTPAMQLGFISVYLRNGEDTGEWRYEGIPLIQYFSEPAGQMTARNSWTDDSAAVTFVKIGTKTMANHDCMDHGTFQIYYKGLLACASGAYAKYGGYTHKYYLQATVSHNGLLIFNPAMADEEPQYATAADGSVDETNILNSARYFYSGGQTQRKEAGNLATWLNGNYDTAVMLGASSGYNADGSAQYGYIAGDITQAYSSETVEHVGRRMLTVYTGDEEFPMLFLTYDTITSTDPLFQKTYLLHTVKEPEVDEEGFVATVVQDRGKMYVHSLFGADSITKIGGEGYAYWINGKNCTDQYKTDDSSKTIWGRIEIGAVGEKTHNLLTAMYVTDASNEKTLAVEKLESETVHAARIGNVISVFAKSQDLAYKEMTLSVAGSGLYRYYVAGVEAGTWNVLVDGTSVAHAFSDEGEGIISFVAPAGEISIKPGPNVIGANGGKIQYNTLGGIVPNDAPYFYNNEVATPLPTDVTKTGCTFLGWYTSPTYEPDTYVTEIPVGTEGLFRVFARWLNVYVDEDYSKTTVNIQAGNVTANGVSYVGASKIGSEFTSLKDENGLPYVLWIKGTKDPAVSLPAGESNLSNATSDDKCVSYTLKLSRDGEKPVVPMTIRMIAAKDAAGGDLSPTEKINLLSVTAAGDVKLGTKVLMTLSSDKITTLRFVLDFTACRLRVYADDYTVIGTADIPLPERTLATNGAELMTCFTKHLLHIYAPNGSSGEEAVRIYGIRVEDSDVFSPLTPNYVNPIKYETDGAELPVDAPREYSKETPTALPTEITRENAVFAGWYTSENFEKSTLVTEVPTDTEGTFTVYAKWLWTMHDEDYSETEIDFTEVNGEKAGMTYSSNSNLGVSYKTKTDKDGNRYLEWQKGTGDPALAVVGTGRNFTNISSGTVSFTVKIAKDGDSAVPNMEINLIANRDATGAALSSSAKVLAFTIRDGVILLAGKSEVSAITEEITTLRLVVDFDKLELRAYDEEGNAVATEAFAIPAKTGAKNGRELMSCFNKRMFHFYANKSEEARSVRFYGFKVTEGNTFAKVVKNPIDYQLGGGILPTDAPDEYSTETPTALPIPTKQSAEFVGWYTSPDFDAATLVTQVPTDTVGAFTVCARWRLIFADEDYSENTVEVFEQRVCVGDVTYIGSGYAGSTFTTKLDENEKPYLEWEKGSADPALAIYQTGQTLADMTDTSVSFTFSLSPDGENALPSLNFRLIANNAVDGSKLSPTPKLTFLQLTESGKLLLANKTQIGTLAADEVTTVRIVIDFANLTICAYDADGGVLATEQFTVPEQTGATDGIELMKCYTNYVFQCYAAKSSGNNKFIRFYEIKAEEGNVFA